MKTLENSNNATGDYSSGTTEFIYTNTDADNTLFVSSLNLKILDNGSFNLSEYGSLGTTAINGINIYYTDTNGTIRNNIIGTTFNINSNADYFNYTTDISVEDLGTGDSIIAVDLNFQKNRAPIKLGVTDKIAVELQDDFSGLIQHTFQISGFTYPSADII